jgi:hypothetical protein
MKRQAFVFAALMAIAAFVTAAAAGVGAKPSIGPPIASPAQPQAGSSFSVAFHLAHARSAAFALTVGGKALLHRDSFRGGVARTTTAVPASAAGKSLTVKLTARSGAATATKQVSFAVRSATPPELSIDGQSKPEGNSGTTPFSFQVTLSRVTAKPVSITYATGDGTATAPSDYVATSGTLTFNPGETTKTIVVQVVGDTVLEPDESFVVRLSDPVGATLSNDTATGVIVNDDTASPVTGGSWQGATQEGNYVFFTVTSARSITGFRTNSLTEDCGGGAYLQGSVTWGSQQFPIASDGTFVAQYSWTGSETVGDVQYLAETWKLTGRFSTATTMNGTIALADELIYQGGHYSCSGSVTFSATLQG